MSNASGSPAAECHDCGGTVARDANFCPRCGSALRESTLPEYCSACGDPFEPGDEFCSTCGASRSGTDGSASQPRARPDADDDDGEARRAFRRRVRRHLDAGWELERDFGDRVVLVDRDVGSIPVHVILLPFTGGLGNLLYGWYHYSNLAETRHLAVDDRDHPPPIGTETAGDGALVTASAYGLSGVLLLVGVALLAIAAGAGSLGPGGVGLALAAVGFLVAPPVERRLDRRHGLAEFGRLRTVDRRVVRPTERCEEPCVVCGDRFDGGLVRRRRDETVLAGVPLLTHAIRHNHYCAACATEELVEGGTDPASVADDADGGGDAAEAVREGGGETGDGQDRRRRKERR